MPGSFHHSWITVTEHKTLLTLTEKGGDPGWIQETDLVPSEGCCWIPIAEVARSSCSWFIAAVRLGGRCPHFGEWKMSKLGAPEQLCSRI